jgi:putative transposase
MAIITIEMPNTFWYNCYNFYMKKAFKYRIDPSDRIEQKLESTLDLCHELYNAALQERRDAYRIAGKSINYHEQSEQLPDIKKSRTDIASVHSQVIQNVLKRIDRSFQNFFDRIKKGAKEPGYPRFKSKDRYDSFTYPQSGWTMEGDKLYLSKIGSMRVIVSQPVDGKVKTVQVKREADKWYVIFSCEVEASPIEQTGKAIGIDVGIENFLTDHRGITVENPKHLRKSQNKLRKAQRQLSKKKKNSNRRKCANKKVAKLHTKIKNQRKDHAHKLSRKLVNKYDHIFYEDLNIAGMLKNHRLAKSISDVGWAMFFSMLDYKAAEAGKRAMNINPNGTSQECSGCHNKVPKGLSVRWHKCPYCGIELHRDQNAARNILARGIEILRAGGLPVPAPGGLALAGPEKGELVESSSQRLPHSLVLVTA